MTWHRLIMLLLLWVLLPWAARSVSLEPREWQVDGVTREALVYAPQAATTNPTPVLFVFHGHGGSMQNAARAFSYHTRWPEAIVVFPQGLNTPGRLTDPEGKRAGWQKEVGDQRDRDLKFFDEVYGTIKQQYKVDEKRVFATGHSNGGAFIFLLWSARGDVFAAVAPCAAAASPDLLRRLKPKPVFQVAGEKDPLVKFSWQKATLDALRKLNQCAESKSWQEHCTLFESKVGAPVVAYIHPGGHAFPPEAADLIVQFFKHQPAP